MKTILREKFYSLHETAEMLELSIFTIRSYVRSGRLAATRIGKELYISQTNLKEYLQLPGPTGKRKQQHPEEPTTENQ